MHTDTPAEQSTRPLAAQRASGKFETQDALDTARGLRRAEIIAELVLAVVEQVETYGYSAANLRRLADENAATGERETAIARRIVATEIEHSR